MNEVLKTIKDRRSIRAYKDTKVKKEDIEAIIEAGTYAPFGLSMDNRLFTGIINEGTIAKLNETLRQTFLHMEITEQMPPIMKQLKENAKSEDANFLYNSKALVIVSINEDDVFAQANCACSMENMMLAASSLGLDTCWLNQLTRLNDAPPIQGLKKELGIPDNHRIQGTIAVGYGAMEPGTERGAVAKSSINIID